MGISGVKMNKNDIINAIKKKGAVITHIARHLDCDRNTVYTWIKDDKDVSHAFDEARKEAAIIRECIDEEIKEEAYNSILDLIRNRDVTATIFALKSKLRWEQQIDASLNYTLTDKGTMDGNK